MVLIYCVDQSLFKWQNPERMTVLVALVDRHLVEIAARVEMGLVLEVGEEVDGTWGEEGEVHLRHQGLIDLVVTNIVECLGDGQLCVKYPFSKQERARESGQN